jgi:hypothetical protein
MNKKQTKVGSQSAAVLRALKRASRDARKIAESTGTPFYVVENGRLTNLNQSPKRRRKAG